MFVEHFERNFNEHKYIVVFRWNDGGATLRDQLFDDYETARLQALYWYDNYARKLSLDDSKGMKYEIYRIALVGPIKE